MTRAVVGPGANLGDRRAALTGAVAGLAATDGIEVVMVSSLYETAPVGGPQQDPYLNAVAVLDTDLAPHDLLRRCQEIEASFQRTRDIRWGPRTLDVDIVAYGDVVSADPDLTLPHPRARERSFVCVPWREIEPDAVLPGVGPLAALPAAQPDPDVVRREPWPVTT